MKINSVFNQVIVVLVLSSFAANQFAQTAPPPQFPVPPNESSDSWLRDGRAAIERAKRLKPNKGKAKNVTILLCGMLAPPTMGAQYQREYVSVFPDLAAQYKVAFMPFILEGVALNPKLNQADNIHPNAEGEKIMTENVYAVLKPLLEK